MANRKATPPLSLKTATTKSSTSSKNTTASSQDSLSSEESRMAESGFTPSRPLTVSIPRGYGVQGPYCLRRPNLSEILANTAPPPWTLSAFMAYLSQNHCLETLEFTMDASRYRMHYNKMVGRSPQGGADSPISPLSEECTYVKMLWQRLLDAYIVPNGPREVNLPSEVRDQLLSLSNPYAPPHPSTLDTAVAKIFELMEDSVLVPFLNSVYPQSAMPAEAAYNTSDEALHSHTRSYDERAMYRGNAQSPSVPVPQSANPYYHRASAPSSLSNSFSLSRSFHGAHARFTSSGSNTTTSGGTSSRAPTASSYSSSISTGINDVVMTDDSGSAASASSPSALSDLMTPPTTPPISEYGYSTGGTPSPRSSRGETSMGNWGKRVSSKLGWKKRGGGREEPVEEGAMF